MPVPLQIPQLSLVTPVPLQLSHSFFYGEIRKKNLIIIIWKAIPGADRSLTLSFLCKDMEDFGNLVDDIAGADVGTL